MVIFNQTLSDPEHARVLKEARRYAMLGFPCGSAGKEFTCNARDLGSIPRLGRSPGKGSGNLPGSSPGGSREFEAGTASAKIRKQLLN